jgi:hypothetical protein
MTDKNKDRYSLEKSLLIGRLSRMAVKYFWLMMVARFLS